MLELEHTLTSLEVHKIMEELQLQLENRLKQVDYLLNLKT